ncbi:MAG: hypothetical protein FWD71_14975 [Oscillospiraceae bacterium]|nr:hypothetical protein [Oscillospiraceae bacterium]
MSSTMQVLTYSPDLLDSIIKDIEGEAAKNAARKIIQCFDTEGFTIMIQHIIPAKSCAYYRVLCFINKSKETVSINTKNSNNDNIDMKIRIENRNTFDKMDEFTENIRNQILNAIDCHYCSDKCEGKKYQFTFRGNEYVKCQYLDCNFRFPKITEIDIASIMKIINDELLPCDK